MNTAASSPALALENAITLYLARKARTAHPDGTFDQKKRWYPSTTEEQSCCRGIRTPSASYPFSFMVHCRTAEHIAALCDISATALKKAIRQARPRQASQMYLRFKVVRVDADGTYRSLYDKQPYLLNTTYRQVAKGDHGGGYYVRTLESSTWTETYETDANGEYTGRCTGSWHTQTLKETFLSGKLLRNPTPGTYAILACDCWGSRVEYTNDKEAFGHVRPIAEHERFTVGD